MSAPLASREIDMTTNKTSKKTGKTKWSKQQKAIFKAFQTGRSHFAVIARAGTGKTTTIIEAIALAPEDRKVVVAFNKKNQLEASAKLQAKGDHKTQAMTLNSLGYRFVMQNWRGTRTDDSVEGDRIFKVVRDDPRFSQFESTPLAAIKPLVAFAKNTRPFASLDDLLEIAETKDFTPENGYAEEGWTTELCCKVALAVMEISKKPEPQGRISFVDQLWLPVVMGWVRPMFDLVAVDEAQDMNATQLLLAQGSCAKTGRIILIGDPRQTIYGFRGADTNGMSRLSAELGAATFPLTITYRCPKAIVELARKLVPDYQAAPEAPEGIITEAETPDTAKPGDAILSRSNAPLMKICLSFIKRGIRAYIEGRDIGSSLSTIASKLKAASVSDFAAKIETWRERKTNVAAAKKNGEELLTAIHDQADTLSALAEESSSVDEIMSRLNVLFGQTSDPEKNAAIVLSSVHKAKGLEWNKTFLIRETFARTTWTDEVTEENNIAYVAITRAKREMVWVNMKVKKRRSART